MTKKTHAKKPPRVEFAHLYDPDITARLVKDLAKRRALTKRTRSKRS